MASKNYEWYIKADTDKYAGKWIVIKDNKIVASGDDAERVYQHAHREYPNANLSIAKVPDKDMLILEIT